MATCTATSCGIEISGVEGAMSWQRYASEEEINGWLQSGDLPPGDWVGVATAPVYGCPEHAITMTQAGYVHESTCTAPPTCDCAIRDKPPFEGTDTMRGWDTEGDS